MGSGSGFPTLWRCAVACSLGSRIKISDERSAERLCRDVGDHHGDHRPLNPEAPQAPLIFATARLPRTCSPAIRSEWRSACPAFLATALSRVCAKWLENDLHHPRTPLTLAELLTEENVEAVAALNLYSQYDEDLAERDRHQSRLLPCLASL